jgi:hypothetical protein
MVKYFIAVIFALSMFGGASAQSAETTASSSLGTVVSTYSSSSKYHYKSKYKYSSKYKKQNKKKKKRKKRDECEAYGSKKWMSGGQKKSKYWSHSHHKDCDDGDNEKPPTY